MKIFFWLSDIISELHDPQDYIEIEHYDERRQHNVDVYGDGGIEAASVQNLLSLQIGIG